MLGVSYPSAAGRWSRLVQARSAVTTSAGLTDSPVKMHQFDDGETSDFNLPYGQSIRLFPANGFSVEDLIEPRPEAGRDEHVSRCDRARAVASMAG